MLQATCSLELSRFRLEPGSHTVKASIQTLPLTRISAVIVGPRMGSATKTRYALLPPATLWIWGPSVECAVACWTAGFYAGLLPRKLQG